MEKPGEECIRFTTSKQRTIFSTSIYDISESGVSFICTRRIAPQIDEIIKMDFAPAGSVQLACLGRVVRIETPSVHSPWNTFPDTVKIGVAFHNLPKKYKSLITESLKKAFSSRNLMYDSQKTVFANPPWVLQNWSSLLATIALFAGAFFAAFLIWSNSKDLKPESPEWSKGIFEKIKNEKK